MKRFFFLWQNRDLLPDHLRGVLLCSWLGHRYTVPKMYALLCSRCRADTPRRYPTTYTIATGRTFCAECNASHRHARGCTQRHTVPLS